MINKNKSLIIKNSTAGSVRKAFPFILTGTALLTFTALYTIQNTQVKLNKEIGSHLLKSLSSTQSKNDVLKSQLIRDKEVTYLRSFLKPEVNLKSTLGESFYNSLNYLHNIKNADFDWTSALPIFSPPPSIKKAGSDSFLFDDLHHYSPYNGHPALRKVIKERLERDGLKVKDENIIVHTSIFEILESLYSTLTWTSNDSILIPTPTFGYYASQASNHGIKVKFLETSEISGWKIRPQDLDKMLTETKSKVFLFTNPVNPTGVVYTQKEVEELAEIFKKHRTLVVSDEVFKDILLDDSQKPFSIGAVKGMENLTITLNGVGKSMGLAGLRVSYGYIPDWLIEKLPKPLCGLSKPSEKAAIPALQNTEENRQYLEKNAREYQRRLNLIKYFMSLIDQELHKKFNAQSYNPGSFAKIYLEPKATNVALLSFPSLKGKSFDTRKINTGLDLASYLSKEAKVALVPGEASFIKGEEMVLRIPLSAENLSQGFERIKLALLKLEN